MITKIVSKNFDIPNSHKLEVALANGRYSSIDKLFTITPDEVTAISKSFFTTTRNFLTPPHRRKTPPLQKSCALYRH